jgi:hypothetical protein
VTKRKTLSIAAGCLLLGAFLYIAVWPLLVGQGNMQALCKSLATDMPISQVRDIVQRNQCRMTSPDKTGRALIHDPRSFGRFNCEVAFKNDRLASARYRLND